MVAKGCDARNLVTHIVENQIARDQVYIIGVPCTGMVDKRKIASLFEDEITGFEEDGDTLTITSASKTEMVKKRMYCGTTAGYVLIGIRRSTMRWPGIL